MFHDPRIRRVIARRHRNRFDSAADRRPDTLRDHHVCRLNDRLKAGIAEPVHRHPRRGHRKAGSQRRDARNVVTLRSVRLAAAENHLFDFRRVELRRPGEDIADAVRGQIIGPGDVERATMRLGQRRPPARDDHGFSHSAPLLRAKGPPGPPACNLVEARNRRVGVSGLRSIPWPHAQGHRDARSVSRVELTGHIRDEQEPLRRAAELGGDAPVAVGRRPSRQPPCRSTARCTGQIAIRRGAEDQPLRQLAA